MTASYKELIAQKEQLEKLIAETRKAELSKAVQQIKQIMNDYGITLSDLGGGSSNRQKAASTPVPPKYRDPATGQTWTGRGKAPLWIKNAVDRSAFEIN